MNDIRVVLINDGRDMILLIYVNPQIFIKLNSFINLYLGN